MDIIKYIFKITLCLTVICFPVKASNNSDSYSNFKNIEILNHFFEDLIDLEQNKNRKINIVHIGDSHIQADFFTDAIRQILQAKFGNGGYGTTFPYSLAKTNGTNYIKYNSNESWQSVRNIEPVSNITIGLSGISIYTNSNNFNISLTANPQYEFNTIKILYPTKEPSFTLSSNIGYTPMRITNKKGKDIYHKVNKGETLYRISVNYNVSVDVLKQANGLQSNIIKTGQNIRIPQQTTTTVYEPEIAKEFIERDTLEQTNAPFVSTYISEHLLSDIYILPGKQQNNYTLNGIILENDQPGLIYHTIGINGAKTSDYNKHPAFFDQLAIIKPDLVIVSLGTNESFGKWSNTEYLQEINSLINNIKKYNENTPIMLMTPPPSMFRRSTPNVIVKEYGKILLEMKQCVIWDLYSKTEEILAFRPRTDLPLMARDKIHYTKQGYQMQGEIFAADFLKAYNYYLINREYLNNDTIK